MIIKLLPALATPLGKQHSLDMIISNGFAQLCSGFEGSLLLRGSENHPGDSVGFNHHSCVTFSLEKLGLSSLLALAAHVLKSLT